MPPPCPPWPGIVVVSDPYLLQQSLAASFIGTRAELMMTMTTYTHCMVSPSFYLPSSSLPSPILPVNLSLTRSIVRCMFSFLISQGSCACTRA
jgi:hypothetical protein